MRDFACSSRNRSLLTVTALVLGVLLLGGCGKSPDELHTQGMRLISNSETAAEGAKLLDEFVQRFPDDPRAPHDAFVVATTLQSLGQYREAADGFAHVHEKYPTAPDAGPSIFLEGYLSSEYFGDTDRARRLFNDYLNRYPDTDLAVSAQVMLDNLDIPVEEWSVVKQIEAESLSDSTASP